MDKNKISILIPCYNKTMFYPKLFKSLKSQTNKNFDIIFLNDASTDETQTILEQFKKDNENIFKIKIINLKENVGISAARNRLIQEVETEYFLFLDPDDVFIKGALNKFIEAICEKKYDIILAKYKWKIKYFYIPRIISWFRFNKTMFSSNKNNNLAFLRSYNCYIWNQVINKKWFLEQKINFLENHSFEDFPVTYSIHLLTKNIKFINNFTYIYKPNKKGLTRSKDLEQKIYDFSCATEYLYNILERKDIVSEWQNKKLESKFNKNLFSFIFYFLSIKKIKNSDKYYKSFLKFKEIIEKYNLEEKGWKEAKFWDLIFKYALKNYSKIKENLSN